MKNNIYFASFLAFAAVGWVLRSSERWHHVKGRSETQQGGELSHKGEKLKHILVDYMRSASRNSVVRTATR
jgi:hypothetical protein